MLDYDTIAKNKPIAHNMRLVHMTMRKAISPEVNTLKEYIHNT